MIQLRWHILAASLLASGPGISSLPLSAAPALTEAPNSFAIRWNASREAPGKGTVDVSGLNPSSLQALQETNWTLSQWQRLLTVRVEQGDLLTDVGLPPMLGSYGIESNLVRFQPQFPLEADVKYRASFYPERLPGMSGLAGKLITVVFELPRRASAKPTTVVTQVYPTSDVLPENLLKFYVHFSASMSRGHIYDHIRLQNEAGQPIELPFLEIDEELWNPDMTRLTLFIDPGRIKRGVLPLEEIGPALEQGKRYRLVIDREWKDGAGIALRQTFQKRFEVGAPDREPIDPKKWKMEPPAAGTHGPLTLLFPKPMDQALAQRVIQVVNDANQLIEGKVALEDHERRWKFTPTEAWRRGSHALQVQTTIEDLAGNNIGKAFEVDLFEGVQRRFTNSTIRLPFNVH